MFPSIGIDFGHLPKNMTVLKIVLLLLVVAARQNRYNGVPNSRKLAML